MESYGFEDRGIGDRPGQDRVPNCRRTSRTYIRPRNGYGEEDEDEAPRTTRTYESEWEDPEGGGRSDRRNAAIQPESLCGALCRSPYHRVRDHHDSVGTQVPNYVHVPSYVHALSCPWTTHPVSTSYPMHTPTQLLRRQHVLCIVHLQAVVAFSFVRFEWLVVASSIRRRALYTDKRQNRRLDVT